MKTSKLTDVIPQTNVWKSVNIDNWYSKDDIKMVMDKSAVTIVDGDKKIIIDNESFQKMIKYFDIYQRRANKWINN